MTNIAELEGYAGIESALDGVTVPSEAVEVFANDADIATARAEIEGTEGDLLAIATKVRNNARVTLAENLKRYYDGIDAYVESKASVDPEDVAAEAAVEKAGAKLLRQVNKVVLYANKIAAATAIVNELKPAKGVAGDVEEDEESGVFTMSPEDLHEATHWGMND